MFQYNHVNYHPVKLVHEIYQQILTDGRARVCDCCGLRVMKIGDSIVFKRGIFVCFHGTLTVVNH
jgi:hypothetical protein